MLFYIYLDFDLTKQALSRYNLGIFTNQTIKTEGK